MEVMGILGLILFLMSFFKILIMSILVRDGMVFNDMINIGDRYVNANKIVRFIFMYSILEGILGILCGVYLGKNAC